MHLRSILFILFIIFLVIGTGCSKKDNQKSTKKDNKQVDKEKNSSPRSGLANSKSGLANSKSGLANSRSGLANSSSSLQNSNLGQDSNQIRALKITATKTVLYQGETLQPVLSATFSDDTTSQNVNNVTWTTSNDKVAKISKDGLVEIIDVVEPVVLEISASVDEISESLTLTLLPKSLTFTAWVGANDSHILLDTADSKFTMTLYSSKDTTCLPSDCKDSTRSDISANKLVTISEHTLSQKSNYQLQIGDEKSKSFTLDESSPFKKRSNHKAVAFSDKLWVIGGMDESGNYLNDVWASSSGQTWSAIEQSAQFTARDNHQLTIFNNNIYMTGGYSQSSKEMDNVWRSEDGKHWEKVNSNNTFTKRDSHQAFTFKDKMMLIGGWSTELGCNSYNDVWHTVDGETWENKNNNTEFSKRCSHTVVDFKNKLYLIGGRHGEAENTRYLNDVWESEDSLAWKELTQATFPVRFKHQAVVFKDAIHIIGGFGDGSDGNNPTKTYYNDVWSSSDGKVWQELTPAADFEARSSHQIVVLNDMLYLIGGRDDLNIYNDIWRSSDGINWRKRVTGQFTFKP